MLERVVLDIVHQKSPLFIENSRISFTFLSSSHFICIFAQSCAIFVCLKAALRLKKISHDEILGCYAKV